MKNNFVAPLKAKLAIKAVIRKKGKCGRITAREFVIGYIIRLHMGITVPADVKLR